MDEVDRTPDDGASVPDSAWSVEQLNQEIQAVLQDACDRFPTHVVGEVTEVSEYHFGTFFELGDLDGDGSISCLAWSRAVDEFDHDVTPGTEAVLEASVDFYPDRGDCQLVVSGYWPVGESDRQRERERLRRTLAEEGLFDDERKRPIPAFPSRIGLVTSPSGSAREDVWATVAERSPRTDVTLHGATVQGEDAVATVIEALRSLDDDPAVETVILTRGGGADVTLSSFDAEPLVRCVASCSTPVVAAIGHEDDETLVEDVADVRAMTPTEAGVVVTTPLDDALADLAAVERRIETAYESLVEDRTEALDRRVTSAYDALVREAERRAAGRRRASDLEDRIDAAYRSVVDRRLDELAGRVDDAYRDLEAETRVEAGTAEARRLRIVVAILLGLLLLGAVAVATGVF